MFQSYDKRMAEKQRIADLVAQCHSLPSKPVAPEPRNLWDKVVDYELLAPLLLVGALGSLAFMHYLALGHWS